ncbi:hypothetical protein CE91St56_38060 [Lachnospiraceae bacterium]|nr:hypothetical protein CE91St56_38060 [Lachnospiraceae bacterium]GKH42755.1 hypothetical protein CE91St57_37290 [Lachnospiraceae bacterium]
MPVRMGENSYGAGGPVGFNMYAAFRTYIRRVQIKKVGVTRPGFPVRPAALQGSFQGTLPLG